MDDTPTLTGSEAATAPDPARSAAVMIGTRLLDRFELRALLGAGAHGTVYEAFDHARGVAVALKNLSRLEPNELYRFKREFRVLADVSHPNLVTLHELFVDEGRAFFTMELIEGTDFMSWVRGPDFDRFDEGRLREALSQLAEGLHALHSFSRLHRDLKPSNVLVRADGHVFLADFGLAEELSAAVVERDVVGTPAYMAPEQAIRRDVGPPSDWYAMGVMLYEALTGEVPFSGCSGKAMLMIKQGQPPPAPSSSAAGVPTDLERLCMALLHREPDARPDGASIVARLGPRPQGDLPTHRDPTGLFGRERELQAMRDAFDHARVGRAGRAAVVMLGGRSGMGKSALLDGFVRSLGATAHVLHGRCYERESVPYKGLDVLVDALRAHLHETRSAGEHLPPISGGAALARLFPVLRDVPAIADRPQVATADAVELRRQAVGALGELLTVLGRRRPLVVVLDDLQWCDPDTAMILVDLMRPTYRPPLLFVGGHRDDEGASPVLAGLLDAVRGLEGEVRIVELQAEPLPDPAAQALARELLRDRPDAAELAVTIAAQAEGSPLFIAELARYAEQATGATFDAAVSLRLEAVIRDRASRLSDCARALLRLVAVAAGPLPQGVVLEAAGPIDGALEAVAQLRSRSFVRTHGPALRDAIEVFHDRIASAVLATLEPEALRECHAKIAEALEQHDGDAETLAMHLQAAGHARRAAEYLARAAHKAAGALAFKRAARLFRLACESLPDTDPRQLGLRIALADTLASDGRSAEAAAAYLDACSRAPRDRVIALRRNAAEQLLRSGRVDEGIEQLDRVLRAVGLHRPTSPRRAIAAFLLQRARISMRGTAFTEKPEHEIDPRALLRIDTCWTAATGLQQANVIIGQYFQATQLLLALDAGEPHRIARALGVEAMYAAASGSESVVQSDRLLERVAGLSRRLGDPRAAATAELATGVTELYRGRFVNARPRLEAAEETLRSQCTNVAWELSMARSWLTVAQYHLGDFPALQTTMEVALDDAAARDDLHTALMIRVAFGPLPALAAGDLPRARAVLRDCIASWPAQITTSTFRYIRVLTEARIARYARDGAAAWAAYEEHWPAIVRSLMLTKQPFRTFLLPDRACSALWAARERSGRARARLLAAARGDARTLARQNTAWASAMAATIELGLAAAAGDRARAMERAGQAVRAFEESGMAVFAACAAMRRAELAGAVAGEGARADAEAAMTERGISAPQAIADMLVPPVRGW